MLRSSRPLVRIRQQGQTLVIALIVLGVLLVLGLVFLGIVNRNILNTAGSQRRSEAADLAEAGIRYAHGQLVSSPLGADWRGTPVAYDTTSALTGDPDIYYTRPKDDGDLATDLGGPDGLGPFVRIPFQNGRALVRVRYGATDATPTTVAPGGPLRNPGKARATLIIEAIGRPGVINPRDPTTVNATGGLRYTNFGSAAALRNGIAAMAQADAQIATSRRLVAFAPIGIIDAARFETNVFNSSEPIALGIPDGLNVTGFDSTSNGYDVGASLAMRLGTEGEATTNSGTVPRGFGSMIVNGDLTFYGLSQIYLNTTLGDSIQVSGSISGANNATVSLTRVFFNGTTYQSQTLAPLTGAALDSTNAAFDTRQGLLNDGAATTDANGYPRGVGRLVPPSILTVDPDSKQNRYVAMTRESGVEGVGLNTGRFGHGQGVYVDNAGDRQEATDARGRETAGSQRSLFDDWLNPNSGVADSGWKGPFYEPKGAVLQLLLDGWTIQRSGTAPAAERTWKNLDGTDSSLSTIRYRVGRGTDGTVRILDTITANANGLDIDSSNLSPSSYQRGLPFNGVLYFEGNVRVRGTIPTGVQLSVVSGATIYIEGSILKGTFGNDVFGTRDQPIGTSPTATLMLMAKDNVAVNTPMFFGPSANQNLESVADRTGATTISPIKFQTAGGADSGRLSLLTELALDPNTNAVGSYNPNPSNWQPFALTYEDWSRPGTGVPTQLLLGQTMEDGTGAASFYSMDVNYGVGNSAYPFPAVDPLITNTAAAYLNQTAGTTRLYGLGAEPWQRYSRFELRAFPLVDPATGTYSANGVISQGGAYSLFAGANDVLIQPGSINGVPTNDTLIGRAAVVPNDIRIEASIFAEQGSFFVIPGPWFNPNPNDTHEAYVNNYNDLANNRGLSAQDATLRANRQRLEAYGAGPEVPFYGEPLDVRVSIVGSVAENMPPPISVQAEWIRKWGWIPRRIGSTNVGIPVQHVPGDDLASRRTYAANNPFVPNLVIQYDPVLATGRPNVLNNVNLTPIRRDEFNRPLPPMPRLPVSPKLAYFGEL